MRDPAALAFTLYTMAFSQDHIAKFSDSAWLAIPTTTGHSRKRIIHFYIRNAMGNPRPCLDLRETHGTRFMSIAPSWKHTHFFESSQNDNLGPLGIDLSRWFEVAPPLEKAYSAEASLQSHLWPEILWGIQTRLNVQYPSSRILRRSPGDLGRSVCLCCRSSLYSQSPG